MTGPVLCMWCDKPATRWCDACIGLEATGCVRKKDFTVDHLLTGSRGKGDGVQHWTCDAPLCGEHAEVVGFVCGKDADVIDRCPYHQKERERGMSALIMFAHEAEGVRKNLHAMLRRARIKAQDKP